MSMDRPGAAAGGGLVEFIRNQPLLLLVYFVFYGVPTVGGFSMDRRWRSSSHCRSIRQPISWRCFAQGSTPAKGQIDAGKAIGLTRGSASVCAYADHVPVTLPALGTQFVSLFKDVVRLCDRRAELAYAASWLSANKFRVFEGFSVAVPMYLAACTIMFIILRRLERRFAVRR
jgi:polar amino acid transport system permease protein